MGKPEDLPAPEVSGPPPQYSNNPAPPYNPQQPPPGGYQQPPPGGYQQPPPGGYQQPPPGGYQQPPGQPAPVPVSTQQITVVQGGTGSCPKCHIGYRTENYTCCGIALAIIFFPLGLICCLLMKDSRCSHCGQPM